MTISSTLKFTNTLPYASKCHRIDSTELIQIKGFWLAAHNRSIWVQYFRTKTLQVRRDSSTWWRHQMETFSALLALCAGNSPVPVNSPHKGQWRGALMFSFIYAWINDWVNNREAGDLRRQDGHYDAIVMTENKLNPIQFLVYYNVQFP